MKTERFRKAGYGSIRTMTPDDWEIIWWNMREVDKKECNLMGVNDDNYKTMLDVGENWVGVADGEVVLGFGHHQCGLNWLNFWFLSTDKVEEHWVEVTRLGNMYIETVIDAPENFCFRPVCQVWSGHKGSLYWAKKYLFFDKMIMTYPLAEGHIKVLERNPNKYSRQEGETV